MPIPRVARHEGSIPIIGDIGLVWPIMARRIAQRLTIELEFMSYPQQTSQGQAVREYIVEEVQPLNRTKMLDAVLTLEKRDKDADYRARFDAWPTPRIYDYYRSRSKKAGAARS